MARPLRVRRLKSIGWAWWEATPGQFRKNLRGQYDDIKYAATKASATAWVDIKKLRTLEVLVGSHPHLTGMELDLAKSAIRVDVVDLKRLLQLYDEYNEVKRAQAESYIGGVRAHGSKCQNRLQKDTKAPPKNPEGTHFTCHQRETYDIIRGYSGCLPRQQNGCVVPPGAHISQQSATAYSQVHKGNWEQRLPCPTS